MKDLMEILGGFFLVLFALISVPAVIIIVMIMVIVMLALMILCIPFLIIIGIIDAM